PRGLHPARAGPAARPGAGARTHHAVDPRRAGGERHRRRPRGLLPPRAGHPGGRRAGGHAGRRGLVDEPGGTLRVPAGGRGGGGWRERAGGLGELEQVIRNFVEAVRREFDPRDTVVLTELGNSRSYPWFRHVGYYLPEFPVYHLRVGPFSPGYLSSRRATSMAALDGPEILLPVA